MAYLLASRLCNAIAITRVEGVSIFIFFHRVWFQFKSLKQGVKKTEFCLKQGRKSVVFSMVLHPTFSSCSTQTHVSLIMLAAIFYMTWYNIVI